MVGEAFASVRRQVVIATKFEYEIDPNKIELLGLNSRPENNRHSNEVSLKRLKTDIVNLLYYTNTALPSKLHINSMKFPILQ